MGIWCYRTLDKYHEGYHGFQVSLIHGPIHPATHDLEFGLLDVCYCHFLEDQYCHLLMDHYHHLLKVHLLKAPLPLAWKGPPSPLLIGTNPSTSKRSTNISNLGWSSPPIIVWFLVGMIRGILGLCFLLEYSSSSSKGPFAIHYNPSLYHS
jgi:hypothetical protein